MYPATSSAAIVAFARGPIGPAGEVSDAELAATVTALKGGVDPSGDTLAKLYNLIQGRAPLATLADFIVSPEVPTLAPGNNSFKAANSAFVRQELVNYALPVAALSTDGTLSANSDALVPSQKAVKAYADSIFAANDAMVFKGAIDCSANPNYPAGNRGDTYRASVGGKIGGAAGVTVEAGDIILCNTDGTAAGNQAAVGANWNVIQTNIVFGTGVVTALGINVGTAGAVLVNGGALGSPGSIGTLPAFTLGGTIAGGGNQINNVVIGTSTPLAGSFTTLSSGVHTVTSNAAPAFAVGPNGAANPAFQIDASTGSLAAGLRVVGAVSGGTVNLLTSDSGANNNLAINAKGTGTIAIGNVSTGAVTITPPATITGALTLGSTINKVTITAPATAATLSISNNKALTINNSLQFAGTDGTTHTFQASDTIVGRATTDTLTNKTLEIVGAGNNVVTSGGANIATAWTAYTPTLGTGTGQISSTGGTVGSAITAAAGAYKQIGKSVFWRCAFTISTVGGMSGSLIVNFPNSFTCNGITFVGGQEAGTKKNLGGQAGNGGTGVTVNYYDATSAISAGSTIFLEGVFEVN